MLPELLAGLAASGGTAVVTSAGTDLWAGTRTAVARVFGRVGQEEDALRRLDRTSAALTEAASAAASTAAGSGDTEHLERQERLERLREDQRLAWRTRFTDLLSDLAEQESDSALNEAAESLRALIARTVPQAGAGTDAAGALLARDVRIRADGGSVAAGVVNGSVHVGPTQPGPVES